MDMFWECPLCKAKNAQGAKRCVLCRNPYTGREKMTPRIEEMSALPEWKKDDKVFDELNVRLEKASAAIGSESLPPKGAIRLIVPNNLLGLLMVVIIVLALAMTLAVLRIMF